MRVVPSRHATLSPHIVGRDAPTEPGTAWGSEPSAFAMNNRQEGEQAT
jgi:hypothetical protein